MKMSMLALKSVDLSELDKAFKGVGFSTILAPTRASLPEDEKRLFAKMLGISSNSSGYTLSARLGVYADESGIVKAVDITRNYVRDPILVV